MWKVTLAKVSEKLLGIYGSNYFPRVFRYHKDAKHLEAMVKFYGGEAKIEKVDKDVNVMLKKFKSDF